jgi:type I restriction enzyme S subunit
MEVKLGFKQTDVGLVPEDWNVRPLGGIATIAAGGTPSRGVPKYWDGDIPWVTTTEIDFNTIMSAEQSISKSGLDNSAATIISPGALLLALYGQGKTRGKVSILGIEAATNQACASIILTPAVSREYVFHFLSSRYDAIRNLSNSGSQENLNGRIVKSILISLPPTKAEQEAIAKVLDDVDALLDGLALLIAKKRDLKQAAMQQLLTGEKRLPGFRGKWQNRIFGDVITDCFSGATPRRNRPDFFKGSIRWITSGELNYNVIYDTYEKLTSEAVAVTNLAIVPKGTFLMAITGLEAEKTRGSCGIVGAPSTMNQSCMAVFPTAELVSEFLFHYYVFRGKSLALEYCQGTKQQSYTAKLVKKLPINLPPTTEEQSAIAAVLTDMDSELAALEQREEKTRDIKRAMMQELLTGKTRLVLQGVPHA